MEKNRPATDEQNIILNNNMKLMMNSLYKEMYIDMILNKAIEDGILNSIQCKTDKGYIEDVISVHSNICNKLMALCVQIRNNIRRQPLDIEKKYNLRHSIVDAHELYKYLYGFKKATSWMKLEQELALLYPQECEIISYAAKEYRRNYVRDADLTLRNVSEHFSDKPEEFFDNMSQVYERVVMDRVLALLKFVQPIYNLLAKEITNKLGFVYTIAYLNDPPVQMFDLKGRLSEELNEIMDKELLRYSDIVNSVMKKTKAVKAVSSKANLDVTNSANWNFLTCDNMGTHVFYMFIDLMSTYRALESSDEFVETKLNLVYLQMSVHEGFKKLYGFNDNDKKNSFWNRAIKNEFLKYKDDELDTSVATLEEKLELLSNNDFIKDDRIVTAFTHAGPDSKTHIESPIIVLDYFRKPISKNDIDSLSEFLKILSKLVPIYNKIMNLQSNIIRERVNSKLCQLQNIEIAIMKQLNDCSS